MKKRKLKNLNLNKRSISNLSKKEVTGIKGGTATTFALPCWSLLSCPTYDCTNGEICSSLGCLQDILKDAQ
jgi:natural product precursor